MYNKLSMVGSTLGETSQHQEGGGGGSYRESHKEGLLGFPGGKQLLLPATTSPQIDSSHLYKPTCQHTSHANFRSHKLACNLMMSFDLCQLRVWTQDQRREDTITSCPLAQDNESGLAVSYKIKKHFLS